MEIFGFLQVSLLLSGGQPREVALLLYINVYETHACFYLRDHRYLYVTIIHSSVYVHKLLRQNFLLINAPSQ